MSATVSEDDSNEKKALFNYYVEIWSRVNAASVILESQSQQILGQLQRWIPSSYAEKAAKRALERIAVKMHCQIQIYTGCGIYKHRPNLKLHFCDKGWRAEGDGSWIDEVKWFFDTNLGKRILSA